MHTQVYKNGMMYEHINSYIYIYTRVIIYICIYVNVPGIPNGRFFPSFGVDDFFSIMAGFPKSYQKSGIRNPRWSLYILYYEPCWVDVDGSHCKFPLWILLPWLKDPRVLGLKMPEPQPEQGASLLFLACLSTGANWDAYPWDFLGLSHTILARAK